MAEKKIKSKIIRCTLQVDDFLYNAIKGISVHIRNDKNKKIKNYEFINKLLILGLEVWSNSQTDPDTKINIRDKKLQNAKEMAKSIK